MSFGNILKKVVQEISRELTHKNIIVKDVFIKYYASLLSLDPTWGISENILHNRLKIQKFVKYVTRKLMKQFDPDIITMKMQLFYKLNCEPEDIMIRKLKDQITMYLIPLQKDILKVKSIDSPDSKLMKKFQKKLIYYITLQSGMGNPTNENVFKEVEIAFRSILSDQELMDFVDIPVSDKRDRLNEYCELVAGIRLFNRFCGKGGEGIDDVAKMLRRALAAKKQELQKLLLGIMQKVNSFTTILDIHHIPYLVKGDIYELVSASLPDGVTVDDLNCIKNLLVMQRQYEVFVRQLMARILRIEDYVEEITENLKKMYDRINEFVQFKIAVPAYQVFPLFREIASFWFGIQNQALLLNKYNDMLVSLSIYTRQIVYSGYQRQDLIIKRLLNGHIPKTDAERMRRKCGTVLIPSKDPEFKLISPEHYKTNIREIDCEFRGFCPWKLVCTDGALIPGNSKIGFVENNGKRYIFSTAMAMNMFNKDPENFIKRAIELFRKKTEMLHLLQAYELVSAVRDVEELIPPEVTVAEISSVDCQTELHPNSENIVSNYKWNIWDLKREALLLANLSHCGTSSTQTEESGGLCPAKTQTYEYRDQHTQTKKDNETNVPKPAQFIFGLRGRSDNKQIQLDLTERIEYS